MYQRQQVDLAARAEAEQTQLGEARRRAPPPEDDAQTHASEATDDLGSLTSVPKTARTQDTAGVSYVSERTEAVPHSEVLSFVSDDDSLVHDARLYAARRGETPGTAGKEKGKLLF